MPVSALFATMWAKSFPPCNPDAQDLDSHLYWTSKSKGDLILWSMLKGLLVVLFNLTFIKLIFRQSSIQMDIKGKQALLKLSQGDMRKILNILQVNNVFLVFLNPLGCIDWFDAVGYSCCFHEH